MYKVRVYIVPDSLRTKSISHQSLHEPYSSNNGPRYKLGDLCSTLNSRTLSTNTLCTYAESQDVLTYLAEDQVTKC